MYWNIIQYIFMKIYWYQNSNPNVKTITVEVDNINEFEGSS